MSDHFGSKHFLVNWLLYLYVLGQRIELLYRDIITVVHASDLAEALIYLIHLSMLYY